MEPHNDQARFAPLLADSDWVLAHFTLASALTTLREENRCVQSGEALVARYDALPFTALSFWSASSDRLAELAARLVAPEELFYLFLNGEQTARARPMYVMGCKIRPASALKGV